MNRKNLQAAITEIQRQYDAQKTSYPGWVAEGKLTKENADIRQSACLNALTYLTWIGQVLEATDKFEL